VLFFLLVPFFKKHVLVDESVVDVAEKVED